MNAATKKILIADDDASIRLVLSQVFTRLGYQVRATGNATTLLKWVTDGEGDLVVTDVVMPDGLNGLELAERLLHEKPSLKVIYASGYSAEVAGGDFSGRQGVDFLGKPYAPADLIQIVERTVAGLQPV